ncbi:glycosyltransferase family 2 protein [Flavobacterium sp. LB3P122]|uniref:glycosyltransferase family 2 protein n=1 Tax=Flavobacterium algoriphilum TaxID=3398738 RepID=UPI003A83C7E1
MKPLFSIIIPTFNHAHFIGRCLDSVLSQTHQNWEAIVVNNFSTDNTVEIVESFNDSRIRLVNNANGGVIAVSRNKGVFEAKGTIIAFLDSDDWWYPNKLEVCLPFLEDYDLIYHDLDIYTTAEKSKGVAKGRILTGNVVKDLIVNGNGIINSSVIIKKEIVDLVGKITEDKNLIAVEDYDYWIRVAKVTNRFKYIDQSLGGYWVGENISYSVKQIDRAKCLLDKYMENLSEGEQKLAISLHHFNSARMYHYLSMYSEACDCYLEALYTNKLNRILKSMGGYLMCRLRIK